MLRHFRVPPAKGHTPPPHPPKKKTKVELNHVWNPLVPHFERFFDPLWFRGPLVGKRIRLRGSMAMAPSHASGTRAEPRGGGWGESGFGSGKRGVGSWELPG